MSAVAVLQSNYIPWKGYFDIISRADIVVFYDDVQYTKNDWRNRNRIKTSTGVTWLTIPVGPDITRRICDVRIATPHWQRKHWSSIVQSYARASFFAAGRDIFEDVFLGRTWSLLSEVNQHLIRLVAGLLQITTEFRSSLDYPLRGRKSERLLDLLDQLAPDVYVTGPRAAGYLDAGAFTRAGIEIRYIDYSRYPEYPQLFPPFRHDVSILDLLFNVGVARAGDYIWGPR